MRLLSIWKRKDCSLASDRCLIHLISPEGLEEKLFGDHDGVQSC